MRVAIATTGRFHVLDLARELAALGHEVAFHSFVPKRRAGRFGLPGRCHRSLLVRATPWLVMQRFGPAAQRQDWDRRLLERMDSLIARRLEPCDVFIGMSGLCVESARAAKEKYGAKVFIERGSRHILSQKAILDGIAQEGGHGSQVPEWAVERELASYEVADVISVPSRHVEESFLEEGLRPGQLFRNPYGVDLSMFKPTESPSATPPTVIMAGTWSLQKGADILLEAWRALPGVRLMHVGPDGDIPFPVANGFEHVAQVPQWRLRSCYSRAHLCVLPSRQDGLSLVLPQALACGLPIVCTDRTGGEDLRGLVREPWMVTVVPSGDPDALRRGLLVVLAKATEMEGVRDVLGGKRVALSWKAYGERYAAKLNEIVG